MARVGIVGTTSWGTTLAIVLARQGLDVWLWARGEDEAEQLRSQGENTRFVAGTPFPPNVTVTSSAGEAFHRAELALFAVPSRTLRDNARRVGDSLGQDTVVLSATKGLELETGKRMSQILEEELPAPSRSRVCALSGPNLAAEIVQGKPSSTVVASADEQDARKAQALVTSPRFRVYTNDDIVGVELAGALKNIIALGAGICDGLLQGDNAKAAFLTRGLAEIARLGVAAGANPLTFAGLAGMGDLMATSASTLSRNHYVGEQIAQGKSLKEIRSSMVNVAEGVDTTAVAVSMAESLGVEMPIAQATYKVLFKDVALDQAISELLGRPPRPE